MTLQAVNAEKFDANVVVSLSMCKRND